jgi:uncharacterized repeat protein (TIGR01451 family)
MPRWKSLNKTKTSKFCKKGGDMNYIKSAEVILSGVFLTCLILSVVSFVGAQEDNSTQIMVLEANILTSSQVISSGADISISVPDYVFLGDVTAGETLSYTTKINNTGKLKVNIQTELIDNLDEIFSNLYLKEYGGKYKKVDSFNMNVSSKSSKNLYLFLNLTNFDGIIDEDLMGHKNSIRFIATAA